MPPASRGSPGGGAARITIPGKRGSPGAGGKGGAAAAAGGSTAALLAEQKRAALVDEESDSEEEEESEEAQMCWSVLFSYFPLLWTIAAEFASAAYEAVSYQEGH